jgi:NAD(P)-dependent dehydrogenase (short-subunit alcohol dehydrogenase family)
VITTDPRDAAGVIGNPVNVPVALVTGAAGGIGRAAAIRFAEEKYALVLTDISQKLVSHHQSQSKQCAQLSNHGPAGSMFWH